MRRKYCEITDIKKIEDILTTATIGRMASIDSDGFPYITPVNYVYFRGNIYYHCSLEGEKLDNIARDPKVCFQVDIPLAYIGTDFVEGNMFHQLYHCVIIRGKAGIVTDETLKADALNAMTASHENRDDLPKTPACKGCHIIEIVPETITAKSDLFQNMSPEKLMKVARYLKKRGGPTDAETIAAFGFDIEEI